MLLYPMKFEKVFIEKVWGGREFENKLGMKLPEGKQIGESWEISAHPNGMGIVANGEYKGLTLQQLHSKFGKDLVGEKVYAEYGDRFPLLIKYLDVNDRLSIQVHPDDEVSLAKHNELGKSESWFIMEASDDAKLVMGMKEGITKEIFLEKSKANDFTGLFEEINVKKGDLVDINPGMVHATLEGSILLAEIQENSDITYRIYDFDREENGKKRELHLEDAAEVIDFGRKASVIKTDFEENQTRKNIISKKYYTIDRIKIDGNFEDVNNDSMIIYSILYGKGNIYYNLDGKREKLIVEMGETVLVPVNVQVEIVGAVEVLRTIIE